MTEFERYCETAEGKEFFDLFVTENPFRSEILFSIGSDRHRDVDYFRTLNAAIRNAREYYGDEYGDPDKVTITDLRTNEVVYTA